MGMMRSKAATPKRKPRGREIINKSNHVDPSLIKGLAIGLGAIGPAIGVGLIGSAAVGAIGRNPEMQGRILSTAFVMAGLVDAVLAFVLLIVFTT